MQTRLLSCLVGGFLGVVVATPAGNLLGLSENLAFLVCSISGVACGYVVSILIDVFTAQP